jgi:hypothetical protein
MTCQIHALVKRAIDQADPMHLLAIGAPEDEYESEIREIASRLGACTTREEVQTLVHQVFVTWFDACLAGSKEQYRAPATAIWAGLQTPP